MEILTFFSGNFAANALPRRAEKVLFPTPPFPDKIKTLYFTSERRSLTKAIPGSGPSGIPKEKKL